MRGVETRIQEIRHRIFREVARMAYHTEWPIDKRIEDITIQDYPRRGWKFHRNDVFLEKAIVGERLRLAMGLPNRSASEHAPLSDNIEAADKPETYYTPPLIERDQVCLQRLSGKTGLCNRGMSGLSGSSM